MEAVAKSADVVQFVRLQRPTSLDHLGADDEYDFPVQTDGKFTVEEYLAFIDARPEEERWQLIDGVATMMPPTRPFDIKSSPQI